VTGVMVDARGKRDEARRRWRLLGAVAAAVPVAGAVAVTAVAPAPRRRAVVVAIGADDRIPAKLTAPRAPVAGAASRAACAHPDRPCTRQQRVG